VVMQRLHENDLAGHLLGQGGWAEYWKRSPQMRQLPLLAGEDVWTPLGVFRIVFGMGHFQIL
jgi:hypothetical protein